MRPFNQEKIQSFRYLRSDFDWSNGLISLVYAFDQGPELIERIQIPGAPFRASPERAKAIEHAIRVLHLFAGVSYYKAACPPKVLVEGPALADDAIELVLSVYQHGLAEFAYKNQLTISPTFQWPKRALVTDSAPAVGLNQAALVALGGGKDSLVSIETLRRAQVVQTVCWVGQAALIQACARQTRLPSLPITRRLAPELAEMNRQGAFNGHVPVTAINSAILSVAALLHASNQIVFSNERSANIGSSVPIVGQVNHQWSKSWAFEAAFARYLRRYVAADLSYYSLLRPYSEIAVARQFTRIDRYDHCFSSCNRNFHLHRQTPAQRWCGACPKCHFVFLAFAPFMPKERLITIFGGRNLLNAPDLISAYDALIEFHQPKPFECVGEAQESRAALLSLANDPLWQSDVIVRRFALDILPHLERQPLALAPLLQAAGPHNIPQSIWPSIDAVFRA